MPSDRESICFIPVVGMATVILLRFCLCWKLHELDFPEDTFIQKQLEPRICTPMNTWLPRVGHHGTFLFGAGLILFSIMPLMFTCVSTKGRTTFLRAEQYFMHMLFRYSSMDFSMSSLLWTVVQVDRLVLILYVYQKLAGPHKLFGFQVLEEPCLCFS